MNKKVYLSCALVTAVFFSAVSLTGCSVAQSPDLAAAIPGGSQVDKATQMTVNVINNTTETLNFVSASHAGGVTHWQQQAPKTIAPNTTAVVTDYGSGDNSITLKYTGARTGTSYDFQANDSILDKNTGSGTTNNAESWITSDVSTGHDDHTSFTVNEGLQYTGRTGTWTVPAGVHLLRVQAVGGAGGTSGEYQKAGAGADITGTLAVTPGEVLTVGVGGPGSGVYNNVVGGWGMTVGSCNYSGGTGIGGDVSIAASGGGATVIVGANGNPIVIAGGGGGEGDYGSNGSSDNGGVGGADGSLTGGNGGPYNQGGKAGGNSTCQGQSQTEAGSGEAGAGGGGLAGGNAGIAGTGDGGGAGSSYDGGLTATTVTSAPLDSSTDTAVSYVTFTAIG
jgi:hypothetical protein